MTRVVSAWTRWWLSCLHLHTHGSYLRVRVNLDDVSAEVFVDLPGKQTCLSYQAGHDLTCTQSNHEVVAKQLETAPAAVGGVQLMPD